MRSAAHDDLLTCCLLTTFHLSFGVSTFRTAAETMGTMVGSALYCAPEILRGERYSEASDIFSLAMVLLELCTKQPPCTGRRRGRHRVTHEVALGGLRPEVPEGVDADFACLIRDAWADDASQRPSAEGVMRRLEAECSAGSGLIKRAREEVIACMLRLADSYPAHWNDGEVEALFAEVSVFVHSDEVHSAVR